MSAPVMMRLRTPADLIAALPVVLGFHPVSSLVLISLGGPSGRRLGLTVRLDLPRAELAERASTPPDPVGTAAAVAEAAVEALLADTPTKAAVVVIGPPGQESHEELIQRVVTALEARSVAVSTVLWAAATTGGAAWRCFDPCRCAGTVPDHGSSVAMAAGVVSGRVVAARREDLAERLAPSDPASLRRRDRLLAGGPGAAGSPADVGARLARLDEAVRAAGSGELALDDGLVVDLAVTLGLTEGREAATRHCLGAAAEAAEELWAALARATPDPEAAEPAALLALSALLRGDGARAAVALDRAEEAWPGHRFSRLLRDAHDVRIHPSALRDALAPLVSAPRAPLRSGRAPA